MTGSDVAESPVVRRLRERGITVVIGHRREHVPRNCDLVVYSPAIPPTNPELLAAQANGIRHMSLPEALGWLMRDRVGVAVAGTHGKSTTTALLGEILSQGGLDPTVIVGAVVPAWSASARAGRGPIVVAEACEYARSFLALRPRIAAVLNVDLDHMDYYPNLRTLYRAYTEFLRLLPEEGYALVADAPEVRRLAEGVRCVVETFGDKVSSDWRYEIVQTARGRSRFRVYHRGRFLAEARSGLIGVHNVANVVAAVALASRVGVPVKRAVRCSETFRPCARRLEFVGYRNGVAHYDDYAHHPAAVRESLKAIRAEAGSGPLWCVFQPHQLWRAVQLGAEFAEALCHADGIVLLPVYPARERASAAACALAARRIARLCRQRCRRVYFAPTVEAAALIVERVVPPGGAVVTMGAGDVWKVRDAVFAGPGTRRQAG